MAAWRQQTLDLWQPGKALTRATSIRIRRTTPAHAASFLERTASVYPDLLRLSTGASAIPGETYARCRRLASALAKRGIGVGDTVAVMLPNIPAMYEAHFGVPMAGAVLNTLNTRLDAEAIAFMLEHGEAKPSIPTRSSRWSRRRSPARKIEAIDVEDPEFTGGKRLGAKTYEELLAEGDVNHSWRWPADEWEAISLNYTSGTTGNRKAWSTTIAARISTASATSSVSMPHHSVPVDAAHVPLQRLVLSVDHGGERKAQRVCLRRVEAGPVFELIRKHKVTHYCGAPIVHQMLINAPDEMKRGIDHKVSALVAAAALPAAMIEGMQKMGFDITHVYGLTETYGPAAVCAKHPQWDELLLGERAPERAPGRALHGRGGSPGWIRDHEPRAGRRRDHGRDHVPRQHHHEGLPQEPGDAGSFAGGWFHSGDLAVMQPDGYVKIKDRSKDIIISGGENISSSRSRTCSTAIRR